MSEERLNLFLRSRAAPLGQTVIPTASTADQLQVLLAVNSSFKGSFK